MVRKTVVKSAGARSQRQIARATIGTLRAARVTPGTLKRYNDALIRFFVFLDDRAVPILLDENNADDVLADYIEHLWAEGDAKQIAADTISGLTVHVKQLKGHLKESWGLFTEWSVREIPTRAPPFAAKSCTAMACCIITLPGCVSVIVERLSVLPLVTCGTAAAPGASSAERKNSPAFF